MATNRRSAHTSIHRTVVGFACVASLVAGALTPAVAQDRVTVALPAPAPATESADAATLRKQIADLKAQRARPGANTAQIDARIAQLQQRLAALEPVAPAGSGEPAAPTNEGVATKTTIGRAQLDSQNAQNTFDAIAGIPGVVQADAKAGGGADNLQIRGIHLASTTGYRLDGGLPIVNNVAMMTDDKAQIQVLKGAGALEYGIAAPAGIVNYVLKRAGNKPINDVSFSGNLDGQSITTVDIGRKFGFRNEFGFRVVASGGATGGYSRDTGGTRMLGAMTFDWTTNRNRLQLDYERFATNIVENAGILQNKPDANGVVTLPHTLDPTQLYSGDWARQVGFGQNMQLRFDTKASDNATIKFMLGRSDSGRDRRVVSQVGTYNVVTGKGTETATFVRDQRYINTYADLSVEMRAAHGDYLSNTFVAGITRNGRDSNNPNTSNATFKQNIYAPTFEPDPGFPTGPISYRPQASNDLDYYFRDSIVFARRFHLTGGLRQINYTANDMSTTGIWKHATTSFLAPALGAVIDLTPMVSLYGSYVKSLEESPTAPINAVNSGDVLPPAPATQKEVGLRATGARGFSASVAYFTIDRANSTIDPVTNVFGLNGTNLFTGYESTLRLPISRRLTFTAGGQYMDAKQHAPDDPTINGKIPENVPRLSGNVGLAYQPAFVPGLRVNAGLQAYGPREINPLDQGTLPGVTLLDVGLSYTKHMGGRNVTFNLNCRNCSDKRYWSSAVNGALGIGPPRVITFSLRMAGQ